MTVAVVTDSAAQLPTDLAARLGIFVVPITVTIDGVDHLEGVDLDADRFWAMTAGRELPTITTSQPSPGAFLDAYRGAVAGGATEIVSIHVGADVSGTLNSAAIAARSLDVPVHLVDSGTASFGLGACAWEAARAVERGADGAAAAAVVERLASSIGTAFIVQALDVVRAGGRIPIVTDGPDSGVVVLAGTGTAFDVIATGHAVDELCDQMVAPFLADGRPIRAAVAFADDATLPFTEGIEARLRASTSVVEMTRYRVGPSIAAHVGPGTAGGFWWPADD